MELLYINDVKDDKQLDEEVFYFIVNYIISENVTIHSNVGFGLEMFKKIDCFSDDEVMKYLESYFFIIQPQITSRLSEELKKIDGLKECMKTYKQLKHRNQLPPGHFKYLQTLKTRYLDYRKTFKGFLNDYVRFLGIYKYVDLYDEVIIKASYTDINRDWELIDQELGEILYNNISNRKNLILLHDLSNLEEFDANKEVDEEQKALLIELFTLHKILLVTIPCSVNLQLNELVVLRQRFLNNFTELFSRIQFFRKDINKIDTVETLTEKLNEFKSEIKDDLQKIQNEINTNLYFLKIKNSDSDYTNVTINLGILFNVTIFNYFSVRNLISPDKYSELEYRLNNKLNEKYYDLFIYYKIDLDINKYKISE
ncbi:MAG: hypothetical protein WCL51_00080 [Bacteroidota bacterium]